MGLVQRLYVLRSVGRAAEAKVIADETLAAAKALGNPFLVASCFAGYGGAFAESDLKRAQAAWHEGLDYSRQHRMSLWETVMARDFAGLEADQGDIDTALDLAQTSINSSIRAGNIANIAMALANLAVFFDRLEQPAAAATLYGIARRHPIINAVPSLAATVDHLKATLGETVFDETVATGANMELGEAVRYTQQQIQQARRAPSEGA